MIVLKKIALVFIPLIISTNTHAQFNTEYQNNVGDIVFNPNVDDSSFVLTGKKMMQYYSFFPSTGIKGEKPYLINFYKKQYVIPTCNKSGYVTIRFVVNFLGKTDRFRLQQMNFRYQPQEFPVEVTEQLMLITQELKEWKIAEKNGNVYDYYQYLTFIIEEGEIKNILP